jgi:hypothetical protein
MIVDVELGARSTSVTSFFDLDASARATPAPCHVSLHLFER